MKRKWITVKKLNKLLRGEPNFISNTLIPNMPFYITFSKDEWDKTNLLIP